MSFVPIVNASLVGVSLVSLFLWNTYSFLSGVLVIFIVSFLALRYIFLNAQRYWSSFALFLLTEVCAFGTLITCCLIYEPDGFNILPLSYFYELPLVGSVFLLGSSVTVTAFHHSMGLTSALKWLVVTVLLGFCFLVVQFFEFSLAENIWSDCFYYSSGFSLVGLHFSHVVLGLIALSYTSYLVSYYTSHPDTYYASIIVWYWHFVDFIWLFVYFIVYFC